MKKHLRTRLATVTTLFGMAGLALASCSDEPAAPEVTNSGGAGGEGGDGSNQEPTSICGVPAAASVCNPMTGMPCDLAAGETCDHSDLHGRFECFPGPSSARAGEFCDNVDTFCGPSTTCYTTYSVCQHYCCSDSDCVGVPCVPNLFEDGNASIGICDTEYLTCEGDAGGCTSDTGNGNGGAGAGNGGAGAGGAGAQP